MEKGFLHLHLTVVILFIIFFGYKLILLLSNKKETLSNFRQKTKIVDMILGGLILITGAYLATKNFQSYVIVKLVLTLAIIPLGIVAMKKENKILGLLAMAILLYNFGVGETRSLVFKKEKIIIQPLQDSVATPNIDSSATQIDKAILEQNAQTAVDNGKAIYVQVCTKCHGTDGKLGGSGAKDLSLSKLNHLEVVTAISNGKGLMEAYKNQLSEQEIEAVASYVEGLRTK